MAKVIAVANQKGGCSKTSVVTNLSIGLAMKGKKVCVIDADPQGSLTASLGYHEPDDMRSMSVCKIIWKRQWKLSKNRSSIR